MWSGESKPLLQRIHPDSTYVSDAEAARSLEYWRKQPTDDIIRTLEPGNPESLKIWEDGRMMNGNTRTKVLEERDFNINQLRREVRVTDPLTGETHWEIQ